MSAKTKIELQRFCGPKERTNIAQPWSRAGYTYATDGKILLRVARCEDAAERLDAPGAEALLLESWCDGPWSDIPAVGEIKRLNCSACNGSGKEYEKCRSCKGSGVVERHTCGNETDCPDCDGSGLSEDVRSERPCEDCDGAGSYEVGEPLEICGKLVNTMFLKKLGDLPAARIGPGKTVFNKNGYAEPLSIIFDGGIGLVMPMHK